MLLLLLLLMQLGSALACLTQLSWLNLPMSRASTALLPLLHNLAELKQLYLQVTGAFNMHLIT
jgi:hypothetical protein